MSMKHDISDRMRCHLESVTKSSGLPPGEESFTRIVEIWTEKRHLFEEKARFFGMKEVECLGQNDPRGAIALTYSGSLIAVGCLAPSLKVANAPKYGRWFEYVSIKLREDVPSIVMAQCAELVGDVKRDSPAQFRHCPIKRSSEILAIAIFEGEAPVAEQEKLIRESTAAIAEGFIELNQKLGVPDG